MTLKADTVEAIKHVADAGAGATALGAFVGFLPEIAAFLSIVWLLIRIYEWARVRVFGFPPIEEKYK